MIKNRKPASDHADRTRGPKTQRRFDLAIYPMFYMGQILHKNAENMATALRRHRLRNSEWRILAALQYYDEMTVGDLSTLTTLERSFVGRLVAKLDRAGMIGRENSVKDRRYTKVFLTGKGRRTFFEQLLPVVRTQMRLLLQGIPDADRDRLIKNLARMMHNVHAVAGSVPPLSEERSNHRGGARPTAEKRQRQRILQDFEASSPR